MASTYKTLETKLIHAGEPRPRIQGAVAMPVFRSSTFESRGESSYHAIRYVRLNNTPNWLVRRASAEKTREIRLTGELSSCSRKMLPLRKLQQAATHQHLKER